MAAMKLAPLDDDTTSAGAALARVLSRGNAVRDSREAQEAQALVREYVAQVASGALIPGRNLVASINMRIAQIDALLSSHLNAVMHHPDFQRLESTWRGLWFLIDSSEPGSPVRTRVLNVTKKELLEDAEKATEFDQSSLFKKVYEEEYGTFGGFPYSFLIGDYEFGRHPRDIALLDMLSHVAAAAHAPLITGTSPSMFDVDTFADLGQPRDISKIFASSELIKWRSLRQSDDARYLALVLPRILLRLPYGPRSVPVEQFNFTEDVEGRGREKYLWGNASWALGTRIAAAFAEYGWPAAIRGVDAGGMVTGLPIQSVETPDGDVAIKPCTDLTVTDRREKELADLGFIPLAYSKDTDYAVFFATQTVNEPKRYDTAQATANSALSSQLQYILAASRFAHYLKVLTRDKLGAFSSRDEVETYLNDWISQYVLLNDADGQEARARLPLREARIDVAEVPGRPGLFAGVMFLRPHFQLHELSAAIRLIADLPPPAT